MTVSKLTFQDIWDNHPDNLAEPEHEPCRNADGESAFGNQCAIRLGSAFKAAGVTIPKRKSLKHCWVPGHKDAQHVLRAEELAAWLLTQRGRVGAPEKKVGKDWKDDGITSDDYSGRTGIVFFKDFWFRTDGEERRNTPSGDHIDVWDGTSQAGGSNDYFQRSKQVWFWELA